VYDANSKLDRIAARLARRRQRRVVQIIRELRQSSHPNILDTSVVVQPPPGGGSLKIDACRVYNSVNLTIANSTDTALTFDSELFDTNNLHSTTTNTSRLTAQTAGIYVVFATVEWQGSATGVRSIYFRLNGTTKVAWLEEPTNSDVPRQTLSTVLALNVNDYLEVVVGQNSSASLSIIAATQYSPHFGMAMIGTLT
jgi:hypothetical protein